jgi:hypothetical protein
LGKEALWFVSARHSPPPLLCIAPPRFGGSLLSPAMTH